MHDIQLAVVLEMWWLRPAFVQGFKVTELLIFEPFCGLSLGGWGAPAIHSAD
jgi:hypothetical protein